MAVCEENKALAEQIFSQLPRSVRVYSQKTKFMVTNPANPNQEAHVTIRWDDEGGASHDPFSINSRNTFSITANIYDTCLSSSGACHNDLLKIDPDLNKYIKFHLFNHNGPMHYLENVCYLAGDKDCWGGSPGEQRKGKDGLPLWNVTPVFKDGSRLAGYVEGINPLEQVTFKVEPVVHEGKARELDKARLAACWPEATDEQLCLPKAELERLLLNRLPALMQEFKNMVESLGFIY